VPGWTIIGAAGIAGSESEWTAGNFNFKLKLTWGRILIPWVIKLDLRLRFPDAGPLHSMPQAGPVGLRGPTVTIHPPLPDTEWRRGSQFFKLP
jgi:hypothetical protein